MKKIISLLLAVLMMFSVVTVAFAADEETTAPEETEESLLGEYDWILDLPVGTVAPALKVAKIVLKLAKVYVKLGIIFGFVDKDELMAPFKSLIEDLISDYVQPETEEPAPDTDVTEGLAA